MCRELVAICRGEEGALPALVVITTPRTKSHHYPGHARNYRSVIARHGHTSKINKHAAGISGGGDR